MSLIGFNPITVAVRLAERVRGRRLQFGWTRETLAERSGVTAASIKRFERTGKIALERLLRLALALDAREGWAELFRSDPTAGMTLRELAARERPPRQRGRRR